MADYTLKALRDLARKHLGAKHTQLKTKEQLLRALHRWLPAPLQRAVDSAAKPLRKSLKGLTRLKPTKKRSRPAPSARTVKPKASKKVPPPTPDTAMEGFFVARVVSESEARRHQLTEPPNFPAPPEPLAPYEERLGTLPASYQDEAAVLLPRDPDTLFVFWDFSERSRNAAAAGLDAPKAVLRVFEGASLVREVDFALESRSFYLHGLPPGGRYRVEAHFVGRDGRSKRLGESTQAIELPRRGMSDDLTVRFLRLPWGLSPRELRRHLREGTAQIRDGSGEHPLEATRTVLFPVVGGSSEAWARR